ncbi:MAG: shikimate dehydrogenase [Bacteroides sp.]|nr:shikimate dehydrogenase [Bacteroides sp.]MCM1095671.1 shikimate dehydrogenase [Terasakiella sp.]
MFKSKGHRTFGLIGYPLGHSFSQDFFNRKFESEGIDARYINFELPAIEMLTEVVAANPDLAGFNVTIPYKQQVIEYLDAIDPEAKAIGAVNVVKIFRQPDGSLSFKGYNSDSIGFADSIRPLLDPERHRRALILGSGGASKAVAHALRGLGVEPQVVSRTAREDVITYADLTPEVMASHTVIVNTTPLGMYPNVDTCPDIPYDLLTPDHICYDLLYNPGTTMFMRRAAGQGAVTKNGLEMLLLQAFVSWNIWNK